jgi:predicted ATPase
MSDAIPHVPRIESIRIKNYRALRDLHLKDLTPFTVLLGPNGSGKSTVFDVFAFLAECFTLGLRKALDKRNRFRELRSRGAGPSDPIEFEIKYREAENTPVITYELVINENTQGQAFVARERLGWRHKNRGRPYLFLDFTDGRGTVTAGETPDERGERMDEQVSSPDVLAVNTLGQLARHPRVRALREFITGWYLSYLNADNTRGIPEAGPQEHLSETGDNLPNVIQYLREQHPEQLAKILERLRERVPRLQDVSADMMPDGRLLLQIKDAPFDRPVLAKFASDGTLKMLAYLTLLYDPDPPKLTGIEEPENQLHPRLLRELAEECRHAAARTQLMVTTHSPFFVNGLNPNEVWVLYRDEDGYTQAKRASDMNQINALVKESGQLGDLWMEGFFEVGDPLTHGGGPKVRRG